MRFLMTVHLCVFHLHTLSDIPFTSWCKEEDSVLLASKLHCICFYPWAPGTFVVRISDLALDERLITTAVHFSRLQVYSSQVSHYAHNYLPEKVLVGVVNPGCYFHLFWKLRSDNCMLSLNYYMWAENAKKCCPCIIWF